MPEFWKPEHNYTLLFYHASAATRELQDQIVETQIKSCKTDAFSVTSYAPRKWSLYYVDTKSNLGLDHVSQSFIFAVKMVDI